MIDGDGSNDPAEIPRFVAALVAVADFAKGSRFLPGGGSGTSASSGESETSGSTRSSIICMGLAIPTCVTATTHFDANASTS